MASELNFVIQYDFGSYRVNGKEMRIGQAAADIMRFDKETVSKLSHLYGDYDSADTRARAAGLMSEIEWLFCSAQNADAAQLRRITDEIICFRVYMRYFLTKCMEKGDNAKQFLAKFYSKLPELEKALKKENMLARTVLPKELRPEINFAVCDSGICETGTFFSLVELLLYDFMRALCMGVAPRICPSCGKYFLPDRSNRLYCEGTAADGRLCREVGAVRSYTERVRGDGLKKLCAAACGRINTRKCRGKLTAEEADELKEKCREMLARAENAGVSCETFEQELKELI